jgi:hypothetical protein
MTSRIVMPVFGEAFRHSSRRIFARIRSKSGDTYVNTNEGQGFHSMIGALDFVNKSIREGAELRSLTKDTPVLKLGTKMRVVPIDGVALG